MLINVPMQRSDHFETCKTFAAPSLWTTVFHACIVSPVMEYVVPAMYKLLAVYYAQTRRFKLTASTSIVAGGVTAFLNVEAFLALEVLSILSESDI
jgi:hypothetical protein